MNIGTAARTSGLPTKTVRYYADIGLVAPLGRAGNGYRAYKQGMPAFHRWQVSLAV